jgi:TIR domain-containing protein/pentapeptide repeat protein
MADPDQLSLLKSGASAWNAWRQRSDSALDLSYADLSGMSLGEADLSRANLFRANLFRAELAGIHLGEADLRRADLTDANLSGADLRRAFLFRTNFSGADLAGADLTEANLLNTVFADTNLASAKGLEACSHLGPSSLDHRTLVRSGKLPITFLRGIGLPDPLIEFVPALFGEPIHFYKCFISYSSKDNAFAQRLHADLQEHGVRCWFAPHDLPIGGKIRSTIDDAIREHDKLLLVLSKHSVTSAWVEHEIERALAKELRTRTTVLFPVRLDDSIMTAESTWAREIREDRNIGDLRNWRSHSTYQNALDRLLRDLRAGATPHN